MIRRLQHLAPRMILTVAALAVAAPPLDAESSATHTTLQPDAAELVRQDEDGAFHLVDTAFAPNEDGLIVIEVSEDDQVIETVVKEDDMATARDVKATAGSYFFRVEQSGVYEVALVANFPWKGTWTTKFQYDDQPQRQMYCRVQEGQAEALHVLPMPEMRKGLHQGIHRLDVSIPGSGEIRAIVLRRGEAFEAAPVDAPPSVNAFQPSDGLVRFAPARPVGVESVHGIEAPGSEGRIAWSVLDEQGRARPVAESDLPDWEGEALVLRAALHRDDAGKSAVLHAPRLAFEKDSDAVAQLANEHMLVEVDRRTGRLGQLVHRPSGRVYRRQAELPFRLVVWSQEDETLKPLPAERYVCQDVQQQDNTLTITYADEGVSNGERMVRVTMELVERELHFAMEVDNQSDERMRLVRFPYMTHISAGEDAGDDHIAWAGKYLGPVKQTPGHVKDYHTPSMMWMDLYDASGGFYMAAHDTTGEADRMLMWPVVGDPPYHYTVEVNRTIEPGDTWSSQTHAVALHEGDWHTGADIYRAWYTQTPRHVEDPEWVRPDYMGALNVVLNPAFPFSNIVDYWKQAKWRGSFFLKLNGVGGDGFANNFHPYPAPQSGGPDQLQKALKWVNERGGQTTAYLNARYYTPSWGDGTMIGWTPRWLFPDEEDTWLRGKEWTLKNARRRLDGTIDGGGGGPHRPFQPIWRMSYRSKGWYEYWTHWIPRYAELGLNIYWDQAMVSTYRDELPEAQRQWRDLNYQQGLMRTARDAVDKAREHKEDFVIRGEGLNDRMMRYLHLSWLFTHGTINPIYRYTLPDQVIDQTVYTGDYWRQAEDGFLYHMRITGGRPWGKGWGMDMRRLTELRAATRDVAFLGRYMDNVGLTGETDQQLARYVMLDEDDRQAVCINTVNRTEAEDWTLALDWPFDEAPRSAFAYTRGNQARAVAFTYEDGVLRFTAPADRLSSIVVIASETPERSLRARAYVPMDIPGRDVLRISLANASGEAVEGRVRVGPHETLRPEQEELPLQLDAGEATVMDVSFTGTADLQDFTELPITIVTGRSSDTTVAAAVAPTLPNGTVELDELNDAVPDYWKPGVRVPHVDEDGYCLLVAANGRYSVRRYIEAPAHLRPSTRYKLSFRARANTDQTYASFFERDTRNKAVGSARVHIPQSDQWQRIEHEFTTSPKTGAGYSSLTFRCNSDNWRHGAWIDDVRLEMLGPATPE